jgi:hypothetical protein
VSEKPIGRLRRFALVAAAYLFLSVVWLYGFVDQGRLEGSDWRTWSLVVLVFALHAAFGWAIREWAALLLPIAVVFLAIPAGYPESQFSEPLPVWLGQIFYIVIEIPAIARGLALRTLYDGWRRTPWPSR